MSDPKSPDDFKDALKALTQSYLDRLPDDFEAIEAELENLTTSAPNVDKCLESLRQKFHQLAGSSGSFGLLELGENAKEAELYLKLKLSADVANISHDDILHIKKLFDAVRASTSVNEVAYPSSDFSLSSENTDKRNSLWLVEDDKILGLELKRQFESFGFKTQLFSDIESAEDAAKTDEPGALLLDVVFADKNINATEELEKSRHLRNLSCPLLFMSAYDDFDSRIRAVRLNAKGYFLKPISVPSVANFLRRLFDYKKIPDSLVLIVEDDRDLAKHFQLVLNAAGFNAQCLFEPENIINKLNEFNPEVVLMDLHMPNYSGTEIAGVIRQHPQWISLPILYLSGETDIGLQAEALEKGAEDFLTKPILDLQLVSTVRARVIRSRQLDEKISRDSLTGLLKHAVIKAVVNQEVARSRRNQEPCTVAMIDIDHFKQVNDSYGHAVGDVVIAAMATALQQRLRNTDIVGRYGGEEFVVVLPDCDSAKGVSVLDEIREAFSQIEFTHNEIKFNCSFSAGVITTTDYPRFTGEQILVSADSCLYHAKRNGRNQISTASDVIQTELQ